MANLILSSSIVSVILRYNATTCHPKRYSLTIDLISQSVCSVWKRQICLFPFMLEQKNIFSPSYLFFHKILFIPSQIQPYPTTIIPIFLCVSAVCSVFIFQNSINMKKLKQKTLFLKLMEINFHKISLSASCSTLLVRHNGMKNPNQNHSGCGRLLQ